MKKLRLLIADDHALVRKGLRVVIESEPGWTICAEAKNGEEAVELTRQTKPDAAVLDISMPKQNGLEAAREISAMIPRVPVLILSMHESAELVRETLAAGARGYMLKSSAGDSLVEAVTAVTAGKTFFSTKLADATVGEVLNPENRGAIALTERERTIVHLLAEGRSNTEIAATLGITRNTCETHRANALRKLGLRSAEELVRKSIRDRSGNG